MISTKIAKSLSVGRSNLLVLTGFLILSSLWLLTGSAAMAQSVQGPPTDLQFEIINGTTGQPGTIDRMTIAYVRTRLNGIIDFEPKGSSFIAPGVPMKDIGEYVVTVWHQDVPYWWSYRGRDLIGKTTTLHVFDTTNDLDNVTIKGLNLVIRKQETLLKLEYMLQIENLAKPQRTILDGVATVELDFPANAQNIVATYLRGPDPTVFETNARGTRRLNLVVPLTPGSNRIRIEAVLPWQEGLEIPVGADLKIASWSILSSPEWLEVRAMGLEEGAGASVPGFNRWAGPPLESSRRVSLQLFSGEHGAGEAEDLFTQDSPAASDAKRTATEPEKKEQGSSLVFVFSGVFIIILVAAAVRKRRQN